MLSYVGNMEFTGLGPVPPVPFYFDKGVIKLNVFYEPDIRFQ